jgi:hypothetical protein
MLARGTKDKEHAMSQTFNAAVSVVGIDIGKNSFHVVGHDERGAIVLRQKWSRGQVEARFANMPPCLVGMEACVGAHHLSCKLNSFGHDARLMPAKYVRPYSKAKSVKCHLTDVVVPSITATLRRPSPLAIRTMSVSYWLHRGSLSFSTATPRLYDVRASSMRRASHCISNFRLKFANRLNSVWR